MHRAVRLSNWPGAEFERFELGRRILYLRRDLARSAPAMFAMLGRRNAAGGAGNRMGGFPIKLADGLELFVRINRRGGFAQLLSRDVYLGVRARPVRELAIAAEAGRRGIPVAEPIGAAVEWVAPIAYRGAFVTRALTGMTLWEFVRTDDDPYVRGHVLGQARQAIDKMHRLGLFHADLNLHNLFVTQSRDSFAIAILDLDKARLFAAPVSSAMRARNMARLRRSSRKLDPEGRYLDPRALELLSGK
jgi:3-deoxy-D-manno-octulosonic acid kinase